MIMRIKNFNNFKLNEAIRKINGPRFEMCYSDFDKLVEDFYGHQIQIMAEEDGLYESSITFNVDGNVDNEDDLEKFIERGYLIPGTNRLVANYVYPGTDTLLNDMCRKNKIEPGFYIIYHD